MAGINRLGKGPPKAGSLRPPDPNRRQDLDLMSAGAENDADYMRMVHDVEDAQQNQSGWLFGRGAFDKGDLLYLRDEEERKRFQETELRDSERSQFLKQRVKATAEQQAAADRRAEAARQEKARKRKKGLLNVIKVKAQPANGSKGPPAAASEAEPAAKRPRAAEQGEAAAAAPLPSTAAAPTSTAAVQAAPQAQAENGLAGLLGEYATDSEEEHPAAAPAAAPRPELRAQDNG